MHVSYEAQVLFVPARLAYRAPPFFNSLQDLRLDFVVADGRPLGESPNKLVQKLLSANLEVKWVSAILDAYIEQVQGEKADVRVARVDVVDDGGGSFAGCAAFLAVDQIRDLEVEGEVRFVVFGAAGARYKSLKLCRPWIAQLAPAVPRRSSSGGGFHPDNEFLKWPVTSGRRM